MRSTKWLLSGLALACLSPAGSAAHPVAEPAESGFTEDARATFLRAREDSMGAAHVLSMANNLCVLVQNARSIEDYPFTIKFDQSISHYANISADDPFRRKKIVAFWNHYADRMICMATRGIYPEQHLYHRAVEMGVHQAVLREYFFTDAPGPRFDVNGIDTLDDGSKITLLDYLYLAQTMRNAEDRHNLDEIEELEEYLIDVHGAKRFKDL